MYGSTVWTSWSKENINHVFKLQKRAASAILDADTRANIYSIQLFKQLEWIPFFHEAIINTRSILVHKRHYGNCPDDLTEMLLQNIDINSTTMHQALQYKSSLSEI